jgi:hypothetical protein
MSLFADSSSIRSFYRDQIMTVFPSRGRELTALCAFHRSRGLSTPSHGLRVSRIYPPVRYRISSECCCMPFLGSSLNQRKRAYSAELATLFRSEMAAQFTGFGHP